MDNGDNKTIPPISEPYYKSFWQGSWKHNSRQQEKKLSVWRISQMQLNDLTHHSLIRLKNSVKQPPSYTMYGPRI